MTEHLQVHVLPQEMLGKSTFGLSMWLLKWLPMRLVDKLLLVVSWLMLGDTARFGLDRPLLGPLQLKNLSGKTPVLDAGTLAKIKSGHVRVQIILQHYFTLIIISSHPNPNPNPINKIKSHILLFNFLISFLFWQLSV